MMTYTKWIAILCAASLLAGCGGQGVSTLPSGSGSHTPSQKRAKVTLRIKIPKKHPKRHRHGSKPNFVSPATKSMTLSISGPTSLNETVNLTPSSTGCSSTVTTTYCQLTLALAAGSYTATITTYDGLSGAGNALSTAQAIGFTVVTGTNNNISLTLSGIPAQLVVVPGSTRSRTNSTGGIELFGTAANKLLVEPMDADGNVIVGAGSPTSYSITQQFGNLSLTIGSPASTSPNTFTITPPSTFSSSTGTLAVQAQYSGSGVTDGCAQNGANCFVNVTVGMARLGVIAQSSQVEVLQIDDPTSNVTITGLTDPVAIFDTSANLYVTSGNSVVVYAPPYVSAKATITNAINNPKALAVDGNGNLFVANCGTGCGGSGTDEVTEYTAPLSSSSTASSTITSGIDEPVAMVEDSSNNLFVANKTVLYGSGSVTEYASGATTPTVTIGNSISTPTALAIDNAIPALFVLNSGSGAVDKYASPYTGAPTVVPTTSGGSGNCGTSGNTVMNAPIALTVYDNGTNIRRVFVASSGALTAGSNGVAGFRADTLSCRSLFDVGAGPTSLAVDDTDVFVAESAANTVTYYSGVTGTPPSSAGTLAITAPTGFAVIP